MSSDLEDVSVISPSDVNIEQTLRQVVKSLPPEGLSINVARAAAEEKLGLDPGFFKSDEWKEKSKQIIKDTVDEEPSPQKPPSPFPTLYKTKKPVSKPAAKPAKKRTSTEPESKPKKRQKRAVSESESESDLSEVPSDEGDEVSELSEEDSPKPAKKKATPARGRQRKQPVVESESDDEVAETKEQSSGPPSEEVEEVEVEARQAIEDKKPANDDLESELSEVLDEAPPKRKAKKSAEAKAKSKPVKGAKGSGSAAKDPSPDEAEVKRLQGWLVKCGIRKVWGRYLAQYETPKAKIKHLKEMLKDAGMDGRYSNEKASAIKEQRELAADLEAVQEGAKLWGHDEGEEEEVEADTKPKRRAAAAARFVDFGDSGEDSD